MTEQDIENIVLKVLKQRATQKSFVLPVIDVNSPITGASQQIGFFGTPKIAQPTTSVGSSTFADSGATVVHTGSTFDGYTLAQVVKALRNLGLLK